MAAVNVFCFSIIVFLRNLFFLNLHIKSVRVDSLKADKQKQIRDLKNSTIITLLMNMNEIKTADRQTLVFFRGFKFKVYCKKT